MAFEYLVLKNEPNGLNTRYVQAYVRDTAISPQVRLCDAVIAIGAGPASLDLQAIWEAGTIIPGGAKLWREHELKDTDEVCIEVVDAILEIVRANGTLAQMVAAGESAIAAHNRQQIAYNRISAALIAGTNNQRMQFLALLATAAFGKLGQR